MSINDVVLEKGSNCNVTIPVVFRADAFPVDRHADPIPIGDITYQLNGAGDTFIYPLIPVAEFNILPALVISKSFSPDEVGPFGVTRLKITLFHRSRSRYPIEALGFTDVLPSGHVIATPANLVNECGGTLTAIEGSNTIQLSDVVLVSTTSVSKSCNIYIDVRVPALTSGSRQTATNTIPGNTHQAASLNVSALKTGEVAPFNQLENYTSATAQISRKATHVTANKEFLPALINGGGVSRVRITISNLLASAIDLTEAGLTDDFSDTNMRLHTTINPRFTDSNGSTSGKCRLGTFTGASGEQSITLSDAEVDAGAICYMEFNVTASQGGNHINAIDANDWVSREGVTNNNNVAATLTVGRQVNIGKGFSPNVIPEGGTSVLTLEFFNTNEIPNNETGASPALIDEMPAGINLVSIDENTCGGTTSIGSQNGNDTLQLDDGTFVAGDVCHIKATVTGTNAGLYTNTIPIGALKMDSGADNPDPATAGILITAKPTVTKEFVTPVIGVGGTSKVRLTLNNPNDGSILASGLTGVSLTDILVNMTIASNPSITGTCADMAATAVSGATTFTLTNATVPPQGSCTVEFNVTSTQCLVNMIIKPQVF